MRISLVLLVIYCSLAQGYYYYDDYYDYNESSGLGEGEEEIETTTDDSSTFWEEKEEDDDDGNQTNGQEETDTNGNQIVQSAECGKPVLTSRSAARIVGGDRVQGAGDYPWQVLLQTLDGDSFCAGSLINDRWVLTAAHCTSEGIKANQLRLVLGEYDITKTESFEKQYSVSKIINHPKYNDGTLENDISLLKTADQVIFTDYIIPVCLPPRNDIVKIGKACVISGWGDTKNQQESSNVLRHGKVPIISNKKCEKWLESTDIFDTSVCAGFESGGVDTCQGDSGGPLVCWKEDRFVLQGVTSWGDGCAKKQKPGVYARVSKYIDWINISMK